jgi:hypothetical protein
MLLYTPLESSISVPGEIVMLFSWLADFVCAPLHCFWVVEIVALQLGK